MPVDWRWNKKAWMTNEFFTEWLIKWNRKLSIKSRKIALILDNATCHPKLDLSNTELAFLANLKVKYCHMYAVSHLILAVDKGRKPNFNIFHATKVLTQA